jgi:hypothetical protein
VSTTFEIANAGTAHGPFFLTHVDLHESNVMINYQFEIAAILDWEFSCNMPFEVASESMPPLCLAGSSPVDLTPGSEAYKSFEENIKLFSHAMHQILPDRQTDYKKDISLAVTEALSEKRAFFAWAVSDVRHMHAIFWDHLAPLSYPVRPPPIEETGNVVINSEDVEVVSETEFINTQLLDERYANFVDD